MLITTSRKPSQRTRTFARSLERVLNAKYVNRGKMSLRDVLIKSSQLNFNRIIIISEMKGNPSRIEIVNSSGDSLISLNVTVSITSSSGRMEKDKLSIRCEMEELNETITSILGIFEENKEIRSLTNSNLIWIKKGLKDSKGVVEFYDKDGHLTGPKIYLQHCLNPMEV
jgi:U3 small nucleolar ribonucleoprotein protein IMP4